MHTIKDLVKLGVVEPFEFSKSTKVDIVRRVDCLRNTINGMCDREAASQRRSILDIIDPRVASVRTQGNGAHSRELVCNISTTCVIISSAKSGTCSQTLKLAII